MNLLDRSRQHQQGGSITKILQQFINLRPVIAVPAPTKCQETIDRIGEQMKQNPNGGFTQVVLTHKEHGHIPRHGVKPVQWMKPNAAAMRIENGCGHQVVEIDEHGEQENCIYPNPVRLIKHPGNKNRRQKVERVLDDGLHGLTIQKTKAHGHLYSHPKNKWTESARSSA